MKFVLFCATHLIVLSACVQQPLVVPNPTTKPVAPNPAVPPPKPKSADTERKAADQTPPKPQLGDAIKDAIEVFDTVTTGYSTENTKIEGGPLDALGDHLITLESFLAGNGEYVSVAMDATKNASFPYRTLFRIPELEKHYGKEILFKLVDTGSAFRGKGKTRMDICIGNSQAAIRRHNIISGNTAASPLKVFVISKP